MKNTLTIIIILLLTVSAFGQGKIYIHKDYDNTSLKENTVVYGHLNKYSTYYSTTIPIDSMKVYLTGKDSTMVYEIWDNMGFVATVGTDTNASGGIRSVNIMVYIYEGTFTDSVTRQISAKIDSFTIDTTGTIQHEFVLNTQAQCFMEFKGIGTNDTVYVYDMQLIRRRFVSTKDHGKLSGLDDNDHDIPYAEIFMLSGDSLGVSVASAGVFVEMDGTTRSESNKLNQFTHTNNTLKYIGSETWFLRVQANMSIAASVNDVASIRIAQNDSVLAKTEQHRKINAGVAEVGAVSTSAMLKFTTNDSIRMFLTIENGTGILTVEHLNLTIK